MRIDDTDQKILNILLRAAATPKAEVARQVGIAASAVSERIKRLEESGVIRGYEARLDARAFGITTLAYIFVAERKPTHGVDTAGRLAEVTGVEEVHKITGDDCFLVKIRARDTSELGNIVDAEINTIPTVSKTRTTIVLRTAKEDVALGGVLGSEYTENRQIYAGTDDC